MFIDIAIVLVLLISVVFGWIRGFVKEVLALTAWIAAFWFAWNFPHLIKPILEPYIAQPDLLGIASFCVLFVGALIALSIVVMVIHKVFDMVGVSGINRTLGGVFGALRGVIVVGCLILGAVFINLPTKSWYQESQLVDLFIPVTDYMRRFIPEHQRQYIPVQDPVSSQSYSEGV